MTDNNDLMQSLKSLRTDFGRYQTRSDEKLATITERLDKLTHTLIGNEMNTEKAILPRLNFVELRQHSIISDIRATQDVVRKIEAQNVETMRLAINRLVLANVVEGVVLLFVVIGLLLGIV